jgi:hypothetical protein
MPTDDETPLPFDAESAIASGMDPDEVINHMDAIGETINRLDDEVDAAEMVVVQASLLERASDLLREVYGDKRDYGVDEAELMAVAILLHQQANETM